MPDNDRLRGVFWQNPESWQLPVAQANVWEGEGASMSARPVDEVVDPSFAVPGAPSTALRHAHASSASFAAAEPQVDQYRGYTICGIAQPVQNLMYRAWAEITQDDRRVERSGLIGPRFTDAEEAEQFALDWARQWIDRHGASDEPAREPQGEVLAGLSALARAESDIQRFIAERHAGALSESRNDPVQPERREYVPRRLIADRVKRAGRRVPRRPRGSPLSMPALPEAPLSKRRLAVHVRYCRP